MGRIGRVLSFTRRVLNGVNFSDVKFDTGGGNIHTGEHFSAPGDDSVPLPNDSLITQEIPRTGGEVPVGYIDSKANQTAQTGEKRIYARDPNTGDAVVSMWLKNDGSAVLANALGSIILGADGTINLNGVIIDPSGNITAGSSLILAGLEIAGHTHTVTTAPGTTGPNQ